MYKEFDESNVIEKAVLIFTDCSKNNNKFYNLYLLKDDSVFAKYGRVGGSERISKAGEGRTVFLKKYNEKINKGYTDAKLSDEKQVPTQALEVVAERDLINEQDPNKNSIKELVRFLVKNNRHAIETLSGGKLFVTESGVVKSELGVLSLGAINEAECILEKLKEYLNKPKNDDFYSMLNEYLRLIPQAVPSRRGWGDYWLNQEQYDRQKLFLEQLSATVSNTETNTITDEQVFDTKLSLVTDEKIIKEIEKYYQQSINQKHSSSHYKLKRVFKIENVNQQNIFEKTSKKLGNVQRLWHGSRNFNLLSILRKGLVIPNERDSHVTGRMFGNGVYFANQSTKALNYSSGFWSRSSAEPQCYMFLADVALGKEFCASHKQAKKTFSENTQYNRYPVKGFDSTHAYGGRDNVLEGGYTQSILNDELIVYSLDQINLCYLCEFSV